MVNKTGTEEVGPRSLKEILKETKKNVYILPAVQSVFAFSFSIFRDIDWFLNKIHRSLRVGLRLLETLSTQVRLSQSISLVQRDQRTRLYF